MLVVDANLVVELSLDRIGEQASADLDRGGQLIAGPLHWSEVPSALHEMAFRGEISNVLADLALQRFQSGSSTAELVGLLPSSSPHWLDRRCPRPRHSNSMPGLNTKKYDVTASSPSRLALKAAIGYLAIASFLLVLGAGSAWAACTGSCTNLQKVTGLVYPPAWAYGRHVHFEPASPAASAYSPSNASPEGEGEARGPEEEPTDWESTGEEERSAGESGIGTGVGALHFNESGSGVQTSPNVYVIFWGTNLTTTENGKAVVTAIEKLFGGLSGSTYQGILTQYFDGTGHIASTVKSTFYTDTSVTAPSAVNQAKIQEELTKVVSSQGWKTTGAQFLLVTAPGSTYASGFMGESCAFHGYEGGLAYSFVPYQGDPYLNTETKKCLNGDPAKNPIHKTSKSASHEYAEALTDPVPGRTTYGWKAFNGEEIADICSAEGDAEVVGGGWAQKEYDNHLNSCVYTDAAPPFVSAITETATELSRHSAKIRAIVNPEGLATSYVLEWGVSKEYGNVSPLTGEGSAGVGSKYVEVNAPLTSLELGRTYHYRVKATNSSGTTYGEDRTFIPSTWLFQQLETQGIEAMYGVDCTSSEDCYAVGGRFIYHRLGRAWTRTEPTLPAGASSATLKGVSCSSAVACVAVGSVDGGEIQRSPVVMRWDGSKWTSQKLTLPGSGEWGALRAISCIGASRCVAVGREVVGSGSSNIGALWNGTEWTMITLPNPPSTSTSELEAVSCGGAMSCVAVGWSDPEGAGAGVPNVLAWNGGGGWNSAAWSVTTPADNRRGRYGVDCVSEDFCMSGGVANRLERWNGTNWTATTPPTLTDVSAATVLGVSCSSSVDCTAVGGGDSKINGKNVTLAEHWNGQEWGIQSTPRESESLQNEFTDVSCEFPPVCTAVGFSQASGAWEPFAEVRHVADSSVSFAANIGSKGTAGGQFETPWGLDVDGEGNVWVADKGNNRVEKFNSAGEFILTFGNEVDKTNHGNICTAASGDTCGWGVAGAANGQFNEPLDVATTNTGDLWVTDGANNRVQKFNSKGEYLTQFGATGTGSGQFTEPWGIDITSSGNIWVADARYYRVEEFEPNGTFIRSANGEGSGGSGPSKFAGPRGVSVDANDDVWVTDRGNNRVTELSPEGVYLMSFGSQGTGPGQFEEPQSIAVKANGNILVGDRLNGRVEEFNPEGEFEAQIGTKGSEAGQMKEPRGVAVGPSGVTYVSDTYNKRVERWQQTAPPTAATKPVYGLQDAAATLSGSIDPGGLRSRYYFEFGTTTSYGQKVPATEASVAGGHEAQTVNVPVTGLTPSTTYHYRLVATNINGTTIGNDESFRTEGFGFRRLDAMAVTEPFDGTSGSLAGFAANWSPLGWASGTTPKGEDTSGGWRPVDAYSTVNGVYYNSTLTDTGSGLAVAATMSQNPGSVNRYFSLWLDATSGASRNGYELRFTWAATNTYTVTLSLWKAGAQTTLASKSGVAFSNGSSLALADEGGTVSAWTDSGSGFTQILSTGDSTLSQGKAAIEGSGYNTRLTKLKAGSLLPAVTNMDAALKALPVTDAFSTTEAPLSEGGHWAALAWDNSTTGYNTGRLSGGWGPWNTYPTVNGAYWTVANVPDTGSGVAAVATLTARPASSAGRYFALDLDMGTPATAHSGYEMKLIETSANVYEIKLGKWLTGSWTSLATKTGNSFPVGSQFAIVDKGGTVSGWTKTGSEFTQVVSASDSAFNDGYAGLEASGNNIRITNFECGPLSPF